MLDDKWRKIVGPRVGFLWAICNRVEVSSEKRELSGTRVSLNNSYCRERSTNCVKSWEKTTEKDC